MFSIEHPVFPSSSRRMTKWAWRFIGFKLIAVVSVAEEEMEMSIDMHMNDDWGVVDDIVMQILEVLSSIS